MITYQPLWETMKKKGVTTYALRRKYKMGGGTLQRLKANETVSTNTLDMLCDILNCDLQDIAEYRRNGEMGTLCEQSRDNVAGDHEAGAGGNP